MSLLILVALMTIWLCIVLGTASLTPHLRWEALQRALSTCLAATLILILAKEILL